MAVVQHSYPVSVQWAGGRSGVGETVLGKDDQPIPLRVAPEFGGPGGKSNPEELLTSAVASCYAITLGIVTTNRRLPVEAIDVAAEGKVDQEGINYKFSAIVLRPTIQVAAEASEEQIKLVTDSAYRAERYCVITNAVRGQVEIIVEPSVIRIASLSNS